MKPMRWKPEKNELLKRERGVSFEQAVVAIEGGGLLTVLAHADPEKYPGQRIMVVTWDDYAYLIPFVEEDDSYVLMTIIPSRKAKRDFLKRRD